jgi:hypothetical protein
MPNNFDVDAEVYDGIDHETIAENSLDAVATDVQNNWMDNMDRAGYRNSGETINSITIDKAERFVRRIGSDRVAALVGEFGRPPDAGHPPPDDLADWVHEQEGLPSRGETVEWSFDKWAVEDSGPQTLTFDDVVYIIGRAIDERGLPAHHFGERAARDARDLDDELERRLEAAVNEQGVD